MEARRRTSLSLSCCWAQSRASIAATVGRPYARGICWILWVRRRAHYWRHTNLQDVTVICHYKKLIRVLHPWKRGCARDVGSIYFAHMIDVSFHTFFHFSRRRIMHCGISRRRMPRKFSLCAPAMRSITFFDRPKANTPDDALSFFNTKS